MKHESSSSASHWHHMVLALTESWGAVVRAACWVFVPSGSRVLGTRQHWRGKGTPGFYISLSACCPVVLCLFFCFLLVLVSP